MRPLITQQELDRLIIDWLAEHADHPMAEDVERAQMAMASPGQWEVTKVQVEPTERNESAETSDVL